MQPTERPGPSSLTVVNLWGAPATGKSTTAAGLFNLLKQGGARVELVTEFAKDLTYEKNYGSLENQLAILAEQDRRLRRLVGQVDIAITDSPLPLGLLYMTPEYEEWLPDAIMGAYDRYHNIDILLERTGAYEQYGRRQTEHESLVLQTQLRDIFRRATHWNGAARDHEAEAHHMVADEFAPFHIAELLPVPNMERLLDAA
ncbi:AAA family ATPase [uncultured Methylobacterium sp.]|jgi:hypothetical protein|uniref:AAA family ATPase n=1 Tax=uncultured Methylobacterium sp. TaxID=157278 RepID=UPI002636E5D4|nr:AAA family ATPase [uncultured Methylobacterium sp.]